MIINDTKNFLALNPECLIIETICEIEQSVGFHKRYILNDVSTSPDILNEKIDDFVRELNFLFLRVSQQFVDMCRIHLCDTALDLEKIEHSDHQFLKYPQDLNQFYTNILNFCCRAKLLIHEFLLHAKSYNCLLNEDDFLFTFENLILQLHHLDRIDMAHVKSVLSYKDRNLEEYTEIFTALWGAFFKSVELLSTEEKIWL